MENKPPEKTVVHFNQEPRRKAEFIKPPNILKAKVGSGGLSEEILVKAQALLENNTVDFQPLAEMYFVSLLKAVESARKNGPEGNSDEMISAILYPAMQLKANGGMFHYPLVTRIADLLIQFLEVIIDPDEDALEIVMGFYTTLRAIIMGKITGSGGRHGDELFTALNDACQRYFNHYPYNKNEAKLDFEEEF